MLAIQSPRLTRTKPKAALTSSRAWTMAYMDMTLMAVKREVINAGGRIIHQIKTLSNRKVIKVLPPARRVK